MVRTECGFRSSSRDDVTLRGSFDYYSRYVVVESVSALNGKAVTRNSSFFKPSPKHPEEVSSDEDGEDLIELVPEPQQNAPVQAPTEAPTEAPIEAPQQQTPAAPAAPAAHQRPQRQRRIPAKLKDYVMK